MSLGQSMLLMGALVVITLLVLGANNIIIQSQQDELGGEAYNIAGEIASTLMNEALTKIFDVNAVYTYYQDSTEFTSPSGLGPNASEANVVKLPDTYPYKSIAGYNDFDDYNGYVRKVDSPTIRGFIVNCQVYYVTETNLDTKINSQTYYKRLVVCVVHPLYLPDTLSFSTVKTY